MKHAAAGFTLIELMIVILIIALVAFAATPLTSGWVDNARWTETQGILEQAIGRAKSSALRNPSGVSGADAAASAICVASGSVQLKLAQAPDEEASCSGSAAASWSATLPPRVSLKAAGADLQCLCFNNKSGLITASGACGGGCASTLALNIIAGAEDDSADFH